MLDIKKMKLSGSREKMAVSAALIVLALFVFLEFIYIPHRNTLERLKKEAAAVEAAIVRVKSAAGGEESLEASIMALQKNLAGLENKFPAKEESALRDLPKFAQRAGIDIKSMTPGRKQVIRDIAQRPVNIAGFELAQLTITIDANAAYRSLGEYISLLKEEFPVFIRIDSIAMSRAGDAVLRVNIVLSIYMVSKIEAS